jgi:hypothetical protein
MLRRGLLFALIVSVSFCLRAQFATPDYVSQPRFWPTQTGYPRNEYAGAAACGSCHRAIFDSQQATSMARTAMRASESEVLSSHPHLSFSNGTYHYDILNLGGKIHYAASDGRNTQNASLAWAFGTDRVAQSYLFKKEESRHNGKNEGRQDGEFYEARVTYFRLLDALNFTPGRALNSALDVEEAMDRQVGRAEVYRCFSCHTTASGIEASFDEDKLIPGVSCEACHGPGRDHIAAMQGAPSAHSRAASRAENTSARIFNPRKLSPEESVDFCGACHGSYWDVNLTNSSGANNVRFQPYRLEQSKCWRKDDARLTCIACHDPHKEVDTDAGAYDHVCLNCHVNKIYKGAAAVADPTHPGAACPVARKDCTSCHMPQVNVPAMHTSFADHRIRIARAGDPFPD